MVAARPFCKLWFWPLLSFIMCLFSIGLAIALIVVTAQRDSLQGKAAMVTTEPVSVAKKPTVCGENNTNNNVLDLTESPRPGPFHDLTSAEIKN
ncbi:amine oxidase, partial [Biomphalaria glabrata]